MPEQPEPHLPEVLVRISGEDRDRRAVNDAWEAVVRQELLRLRRGHARDKRFTRPGSRPRDE